MNPIPNGSTPSAEPQGRNPEQTTGAAVGGISANIPDDVMKAACSVRGRDYVDGDNEDMIIARAIMAERERCALILDAECARLLALQTGKEADYGVDLNLRLVAVMLPELSNRIRKGA